MPVTVASGERSSSKVTYAHPWDKEQLDSLAILSMENDIAHSLNQAFGYNCAESEPIWMKSGAL